MWLSFSWMIHLRGASDHMMSCSVGGPQDTEPRPPARSRQGVWKQVPSPSGLRGETAASRETQNLPELFLDSWPSETEVTKVCCFSCQVLGQFVTQQ